jgi:F1F0 ATPase subunit 2
MPMNEALPLALAWLAGGLLGALFFGGLWWTIHRGVSSCRPALWFLGSPLLRISATLAGFYFVSGGQWKRLVACLIGFVTARFIVLWRVRSPGKTPHRPTPETSHAP